MLEVIGSSLFGLLWEMFGNSAKQQVQLESIAWHDAVIFQLPAEEIDPVVQSIVNKYLQNLSQKAIAREYGCNQIGWNWAIIREIFLYRLLL
jgi:hypothetical protein